MPNLFRRMRSSLARRVSTRIVTWFLSTIEEGGPDLSDLADLETPPEDDDPTNSRPLPDVVARMICLEHGTMQPPLDGGRSIATAGVWRGGWLFYWSWVAGEFVPSLVVDCMEDDATPGFNVASEAWVREVMVRVQDLMAIQVRCSIVQPPPVRSSRPPSAQPSFEA